MLPDGQQRAEEETHGVMRFEKVIVFFVAGTVQRYGFFSCVEAARVFRIA